MQLVYPKLPRAGLGNMLFVWAKAILFSELNSFPVIAPSWNQLRIGPYLRNERDKRMYQHFFTNKNYVSRFSYLLTFLSNRELYYNPPIEKLDLSNLDQNSKTSIIYIFDKIPSWNDDFNDLKEHQKFIKQQLIATIRPTVFKTISERPAPEIAIHVRRGDFKALKPDEKLTSDLAHARTPINWFINVLSVIRKIAGYTIPVTIFSDGYDQELSELLSLPEVHRPLSSSALSDLFTMSRSKLLIASSRSTFSAWASYLGQCPTVWHPAHFDSGVFSTEVSKTIFEGGFEPEFMPVPDLLINNIKSIF
ncbi:MAG: alpha-1,2-fucosyltransferase [Coleofasciculaceae cyanobacterium]